MLKLRRLARHEIEQLWSIDRSGVYEAIYRMEGDQLVRVPMHIEAHGWTPEQAAHATPQLFACLDRGGAGFGMFDDQTLVGVAVVDTLPRGPQGEQRQLQYLHVSRAYRGQGVGRALMQEAKAFAAQQGATALYISATPTENTVNFYRGCGAVLALPPDPDLLAEEPDDIHFLCPVVESRR